MSLSVKGQAKTGIRLKFFACQMGHAFFTVVDNERGKHTVADTSVHQPRLSH